MNKKGGLMDLPVNLLVMFIVITFMIVLIPGLVEILNTAQRSDSLNCAGFIDWDNAGNPVNYSYNSTIGTKSSIGCLAIKLYIPYIVLGVLISVVAMIFYGKVMAPSPEVGY